MELFFLICVKKVAQFFSLKDKRPVHLIETLEYSKKMQYIVMRYEIRNIHILHSKNTRQAKMKHFMLNKFSVHFVAYTLYIFTQLGLFMN